MNYLYFTTSKFKALLIGLCFSLILFQSATAQNNRIATRSGQEIFSSGMNMAWGQNFAFNAINLEDELFEQALDELSAAGGNTMRWWLHINGLYSPLFENDTVSGLSDEIENVRRILDLAYERHMTVAISLWSHDMLSNGGQDLDAIEFMLEDTVGQWPM